MITAIVFTLDEEINIARCLESLAWTDDVIVVDSFSTDATEAISRRLGARFFQNRFEGFGVQRMWALQNTAPRYPWILILDADERVPPELAEEMKRVVAAAPPGIGAWRVRRRFHLWGRWLRYSALYPNWVVRLVHRDRVRYVNRGHAETQVVDGEIASLEHDLIDENLKGIDEWYGRQERYSAQEAVYEIEQERTPARLGALFSADPLARRAALKQLASRVPFRPTIYFLYAYLFRGGFLEGRDGLRFCLMRADYQRMIVRKKRELRARK